MPYCRKCGAKLEDDARFCHVCGSPVAAVTPVPATHMRGRPFSVPRLISKSRRFVVLKDRRLWFAIILTVVANFAVFTISGDSPLLPLRWFASLVFSLVLPGYCLLGASFPKKELGSAETICLSVILSFGILALDGLLVSSLFGEMDIMTIMLFSSLEVLALMIITVFMCQRHSVSMREIDTSELG